MKKIISVLIILMLLLPFSYVSAADEVLAPEIYCYSSSSNGHSCVNVIIINDEEILRIADLSDDELYDEFEVTENSSLQIQFDYSVDEIDSWNYEDSWEPDRAGFFKSPVSLRVDADEEIIEKQILDLEYDEYLDILSEHAYVGDNDGWSNVNLYDFYKHPVYIRARFVYTIEDAETGKYINFISGWSDAVRVEERIIIDENITPPAITVDSAPETVFTDGNVSVYLHADEETKDAVMKLSHFDADFDVTIEYKADENEYVKADIDDDTFRSGKKYTFAVTDPSKINTLTIRTRISSDGSDRYDIDPVDSGYSEEVTLTLRTHVTEDDNKETTKPPATVDPEPQEKDGFPVIYLLPVFVAIIAGGGLLIRKSIRNK